MSTLILKSRTTMCTLMHLYIWNVKIYSSPKKTTNPFNLCRYQVKFCTQIRYNGNWVLWMLTIFGNLHLLLHIVSLYAISCNLQFGKIFIWLSSIYDLNIVLKKVQFACVYPFLTKPWNEEMRYWTNVFIALLPKIQIKTLPKINDETRKKI